MWDVLSLTESRTQTQGMALPMEDWVFLLKIMQSSLSKHAHRPRVTLEHKFTNVAQVSLRLLITN